MQIVVKKHDFKIAGAKKEGRLSQEKPGRVEDSSTDQEVCSMTGHLRQIMFSGGVSFIGLAKLHFNKYLFLKLSQFKPFL